jgi:23S rRNA (uracil1939-C5)-methyltransferase
MIKTLTIESMAYEGAGVAHTAEGKAVFVHGAVTGDIIRVLSARSLATYDRCESFELLEGSPHRINAPCPYADACGGCPWQVLASGEQQYWKRRFVVDALTRIGGLDKSDELVGACVPSPLAWHYRNKVELGAFVQDGRLGLGLKKRQSHEHVRIDECLLLPKALVGLPKSLAGALDYSLKDARAQLSRVAVRGSLSTGSTELALYMLPSGVNRPLLAKTLGANAELSSLVRVIIASETAERKVKKVEVLSGAGYWHEELAGTNSSNHYKISAPSFFQINSLTAAAMIRHLEGLLDALELDASAPVADLYSGAGTFTLPLARRFDSVCAIESSGSSVRDLRRNLEEQRLEAEVIGGDVARELAQLAPAQLALINPPRSGLKPEAVKVLLAYAPPQLVYVSCNLATLARDIALLAKGGYELVRATPFDQFPQSYHVEVMALLTKR